MRWMIAKLPNCWAPTVEKPVIGIIISNILTLKTISERVILDVWSKLVNDGSKEDKSSSSLAKENLD